jgi:hypothetical protein
MLKNFTFIDESVSYYGNTSGECIKINIKYTHIHTNHIRAYLKDL